MGLAILTAPFPWSRYSKKLMAKIDNPRSVGYFTKDESEARDMRLVEGMDGSIEDGNAVCFYWLVDRDDGIIVDAKFQVYGQSALIGSAEAACDLLIGKNYDQARRVTADLIDKQVRDRPDQAAFPGETYPHLNLVLGAISHAAEKCLDIPISVGYVAPPVPHEMGEILPGGHPGWDTFSTEQKLVLIEEVLDRDIRPYIALDAGGIKVLHLINDREVHISYQGSCTTCYSSIGATLSFIQKTLQSKVHPSITVIPDMTHLDL